MAKACKHKWRFHEFESFDERHPHQSVIKEKCQKCDAIQRAPRYSSYWTEITDEIKRRTCQACEELHAHESPSGDACIKILAKKVRDLEERLNNASISL